MAVPAPFAQLKRLHTWISKDFLGGPKILKMSWVINLQKGGTLPFVLLLMVWWSNWSIAAWVYLALHGSYGLLWLLKHYAFPDPGWEERVTFGAAVNMWVFTLALYWIAPVLLITDVLGTDRPEAPAWLLGVAIGVYVLGVSIMLAADAQKHFTLRHKRGLITDGMFRYTRNPNYLGEMMLYAAFALVVQHWLPWVVLAWVWLAVFLTNMVVKDDSLSRYPEWAAYKARSGMLLPRFW